MNIDQFNAQADGPPSPQRLRYARQTAERLGAELPRACLTSWKACRLLVEQSRDGRFPHMPTFGLLGPVERMLSSPMRPGQRRRVEAVKLRLLAAIRAGGEFR